MPNLNESLKLILDTKGGIFENNEVDMPRFVALKSSFETEIARIRNFSNADVRGGRNLPANEMEKIRNISFKIEPMSISQLKANMNELIAVSTLSHLGIFYGLTPATNQMTLVMRGVKLDGSDDGIRLHLKPPISHAKQFSTSNLTPQQGSNIALRNHFKQTFKTVHGENNFVIGAYMKFASLLSVLTQLEAENCNQLQITFGFMKPEVGITSPFNLNCFHLLFRGVKADNVTLSTKIFSTFDNEPGYSGPKPSCPPFGEE